MAFRVLPTLLGGVVALSLANAAAEEDDEDEASREPLRCLSMNRIRATQVLDNQRVLFFQGRDRVFLNRLDRECLGLARYGTFEYNVKGGAREARLCSTDVITVLEPTGRGLNCELGMFEPLSQAEAESLVSGPSPAVISVPVEPPEPEPDAEPPAEPGPPQ
nr:hypothetical protein [uncultured bacterium]